MPLLEVRSETIIFKLTKENRKCVRKRNPGPQNKVVITKYYHQHIIQDGLDLIFRIYGIEPGKNLSFNGWLPTACTSELYQCFSAFAKCSH